MKRLTLLLIAVVLSGMFVPTAAVGAETQQRADLLIEQPSYIDSSVEIEQTKDTVVYRVRGGEHNIRLQNADHADVVSAGIEDGSGSLVYNAQSDAYEFDTEGKEGSTTLFWEVEQTETREVQEGNETVMRNETITVRYTAVIQAKDVDWAHRPVEADKELQTKANNWESVKQEAESLAPNQDTEEVISSAFTYFRFFDSPFSTFVADMRATLTLMFLRPGGWVITGIFLGVSLIGLAYGARYRNRTQKQFEDLADLQVEKDEAYLQKVRRIVLQQNDWNQFLPDDLSRSMRDFFGRNVWQGYKQYLQIRSPIHIKGVVLQMMAQIGYTGRVERDDAGDIVDAHVVDDTRADGGTTGDRVDLARLDPDDAKDREFIAATPGNSLNEDVFNADIDMQAVDFGIGHREIDDSDLLDEINPDVPGDFEDEEQLAMILAELIQFVTEHQHTDELGRPNRNMDIVSFLAEMDSVLADEADFALGQIQKRLLLKAAEEMDPGDDLQDTVDRVQTEGVDK